MSTRQLQRINASGWRTGFGNLLRKENEEWWGTRTWWVQAIVWALILNGILAILLWGPTNTPADMTAEQAAALQAARDTIAEGMQVFIMMAGMALPVGVTIIGQGLILDEKRSGTLEWVLSKPASRTALITSKLIASAIGIIVILVALQGALAYLQLTLKGTTPEVLPFIGAMALVGLNALFYLALTMMLGVLFDGRGAVIGICMLLIFGYQFFVGLAPWLFEIMPWGLASQGPTMPLAVLVAKGQPLTSVTPILATLAWIAAFIAITIWRFRKQEF
jgi:ABC-2 type transport system permease protein